MYVQRKLHYVTSIQMPAKPSVCLERKHGGDQSLLLVGFWNPSVHVYIQYKQQRKHKSIVELWR